MASVVLNGLFWMPSILFPASAVVEGETISCRPKPVAAAAPAMAAPARNLRRFRYKLLGVISDERMTVAVLINMEALVSIRSATDGSALSLFSIFHPIGRAPGEKVSER